MLALLSKHLVTICTRYRYIQSSVCFRNKYHHYALSGHCCCFGFDVIRIILPDPHLPKLLRIQIRIFQNLRICISRIWGCGSAFFRFTNYNFQCCGAGAGGAEIILRGWSRYRSRNYLFRLRSSGADSIILLLAILLYCRQFGECHCQDELRLISDQLSAVYSYFFCSTVFILLLSGNSGPELELEPEPK